MPRAPPNREDRLPVLAVDFQRGRLSACERFWKGMGVVAGEARLPVRCIGRTLSIPATAAMLRTGLLRDRLAGRNEPAANHDNGCRKAGQHVKIPAEPERKAHSCVLAGWSTLYIMQRLPPPSIATHKGGYRPQRPAARELRVRRGTRRNGQGSAGSPGSYGMGTNSPPPPVAIARKSSAGVVSGKS